MLYGSIMNFYLKNTITDMSEIDNIKELVNPEATIQDDKTKMSSYTGQEQPKEQYYGEAYNDSNVNELVDETTPHVVVLVGYPEYGKSTFVSSFYHAVMTNGSIGKYKFVDSETILGFERRSQIRLEETRVKKRLDRTPMYLNYFLSLVFINTETGRRVKLVLSDKAGDTYKDYGKIGEKIKSDKAIKRAQHIIFFLDAYDMATEGYLDLQQNLGLLVPRMVKYDVFFDRKRVDVVFNKIDLLKEEDKEDYETNKEEILNIIKQGTAIHKMTELSCLRTPLNESVNEYFEYLLDSCEEPEAITEDLRQQVDWVSCKLKEIEL